VAESITTNQIAANTIKAGNIEAGTITVTEIDTSTITSLSDLVIGAPQILIQGTTYFSDWLGDDAGITKIEGGNIVTGSITLNEINFVPVETDSVIASINASSEGIEINAKYITISGTTVFNSSWASASNAQSAISTSGVNNDAGWTDDAVADAAQSAAEAAQADADTANGLLTDIALDTKITPVEKLTIKPLWDDIIVEATATTGTIPAQAIIFGVAHTNFDNAYSALSTYLLTTVNVFASMTTTSTIVRADWDTAWKNYYNERTLILNAIATEAKALADTAQGDATQAIADAATAQGTADGKVTTFYADEEPTAEGTGDLWVDTNDGNKLYRWSGSAWTEIQDDDIATAIANAGTAQTTADGKIVSFYADEPPTADGVGDFWTDTNDNNKLYRWSGSAWISVRDATIATAQTAAEAAQADADTAQGELNNISSDSKITPVEKLTIKPLWDTIVTEKSSIDTQADSYSVSKTAYGTAYTNLNTYLNTTIKVFVSMTTTSTIARTTWDGYWEAYYNAKVDILNAIATATAGDMTQTFIDGGVITTGTIQVVQGGSYVAGMTGSTSGDTAVRFWAGSSFANRAAAPYRVTQGGLVTANNADIQGLIKATSGWIGGSTSGWKIDSNVLQAYSGVTKIIELSATGPHIQCLKDSNNYVQMTPASSDPRFDVFKAGIRRIRLNEDGLTFFTDAGAETNKIGLGVTDGDVTFGGGYVRLFSGGIRISYDYSGTGLNLADESTTYLRMYVAASAQSYAGTIDLPNSDILVIRDKTGPPGNKIVDFVGRTGQGNNYGLVDVYSPIGLLATSTSPTGASNGWMFYNTTYNEVWAYIGGSWEALDHGGGATGTVTSVATSGAITGGTITTTGTISHSTSNGYKHFPSSGSTYQMIRNSATGTGAWTSNLYIGGLSTYYIYRDSSSPYDTIFEVPSGTDYAFSRGGTVYTKIDDNFWTKGNLYADGQLSVGGTIQNTVGDIIINNGNLQLKKNGAIIAIDDSGGTTRYLTVQWNATLSKYILST